MKDIIALIPARSGSKGVPNKNIMLFNGLPLLAYSIVVAKKSKLIDRVIVSTDSQEYAEIAIKYGAEVPFLGGTEGVVERITVMISSLGEQGVVGMIALGVIIYVFTRKDGK